MKHLYIVEERDKYSEAWCNSIEWWETRAQARREIARRKRDCRSSYPPRFRIVRYVREAP